METSKHKPYHILLLPSWYPRNPSDISGVFFRDQALALRRYGHRVGVIAPQMRSLRTLLKKSTKRASRYYELDVGLPTYRGEVLAALPWIPYGNYWLFKRAAHSLLSDYIRQHGTPDIIHAHASVFGGVAAATLSKTFGIPVALTEHSTGFARGVYSGWQLRLAEKAFSAAGSCITVSPSLGELLATQFPATKGRWKWIPNVVAERFKASERFNSQQRPVRFLNLALMTEKKGQLDLVKAFCQVLQAGFSAELWLAGDGPIRFILEQQTRKLGIDDKVKFLGLVEPKKVPALLEDADVMVVSSHYETFGVVAAEALMAGLPVIATRCGGPECIVAENDGLLVPPKQPEALGKAMFDMGVNLASYDRQDIARRALGRFSGPAVAAQLTAEYERLLAGHSSMALPV